MGNERTVNISLDAEEVPTKTADSCQRVCTPGRRKSSSFRPELNINSQTPREDTRAMNRERTPSKSYLISEKFTQPAKMPTTNTSYPFPSPMHAVLIQYDKPIIEASSSDGIRRNGDRQQVQDAKRHQAKSDAEAEEELSTTKFIQKLVCRSNSFKRLKELKTQKKECRKMKELRNSVDKEEFVKNKIIPVDINLDEEMTTREKMQSLPSPRIRNVQKTNAAKCDSPPSAQRQNRKNQVPSRKSSNTRSSSLSRVSVTSSDGGYFSHPNSPQSSLKLGRSSRQSYQSQISSISNGDNSAATEDNKINLVEQNSKSGNVFRDTTKVQSKICQRSHSFSGESNLPLSIYQQRSRSHSTSSPMKPFSEKRYSFSGSLPASRRESNIKPTLSFLAVMNDVPDTFI